MSKKHWGPIARQIKSIYTAPSLEAAVRRGHFPTEQAAIKMLYLTAIEKRKNRSNSTDGVDGSG